MIKKITFLFTCILLGISSLSYAMEDNKKDDKKNIPPQAPQIKAGPQVDVGPIDFKPGNRGNNKKNKNKGGGNS